VSNSGIYFAIVGPSLSQKSSYQTHLHKKIK